jgi:hypothetical protein
LMNQWLSRFRTIRVRGPERKPRSRIEAVKTTTGRAIRLGRFFLAVSCRKSRVVGAFTRVLTPLLRALLYGFAEFPRAWIFQKAYFQSLEPRHAYLNH